MPTHVESVDGPRTLLRFYGAHSRHLSGPVRSGPVRSGRSGSVRSGPIRSDPAGPAGPVRSGPDRTHVVALEVCPPAADCSRDARPPCAGHELWGARGCAGAQPYTGPGPRGPGPWAWASACSAGPVPRGRALTPRPGPGLGPRARAAGRGPRRAPGPGGDDASNSRSFLCRPLLQALRLARGVEPQRGPAPRPRAHDWYIEHIWGSRDGAAHRFASWSAPGKPSCAIPHQHPSVHLNLVPNVVFVRRRPAAVRKHSMHDHQVGAIQMHASTF